MWSTTVIGGIGPLPCVAACSASSDGVCGFVSLARAHHGRNQLLSLRRPPRPDGPSRERARSLSRTGHRSSAGGALRLRRGSCGCGVPRLWNSADHHTGVHRPYAAAVRALGRIRRELGTPCGTGRVSRWLPPVSPWWMYRWLRDYAPQRGRLRALWHTLPTWWALWRWAATPEGYDG